MSSLQANPRLDPTHMPVERGLMEFGEHYARYMLADSFAYQKNVLDIGTGYGYGAAYLARRARSVYGFDKEADENMRGAWAQLESTASRANLLLDVRDAEQGWIYPLAQNNSKYDLVTMFEVWEHLENPGEVLERAVEVLSEDGLMIVSTPDRESNPPGVLKRSPHHVREYTLEEFTQALRLRFSQVTMLRQDFASATIIRPLHTRYGQFEHAPTLPHAFVSGYNPQRWGVWIALCSNDMPVSATSLALVYETRHIE